MRVRMLELRLLAALLVVLWAAGAVAVLVGYRPGGPIDGLVAVAALIPAGIAAAAVVWPPLARGPRAAALIGWLGVITALLLVPALAGIIGNLAAGGRQTLVPSLEVAYAALLPLCLTCLFTGLGIAGALLGQTSFRRRRLIVGSLLALAFTIGSAAAFGGAALANDLALRAQPPRGASPLGPTDPTLVPPVCDGTLRAGDLAAVTLTASGRVDGTEYGTLELAGVRNGDAESWTGTRETPWATGDAAYVRVADNAWYRTGDVGTWSARRGRPTLDSAVVEAALDQASREASEDVGFELVEGAKARHCRLAIDGPTAVEALPALLWLVHRDLFDEGVGLSDWRGEIEWWTFADAELGMARLVVNGPPGGDWQLTGFQATVGAELVARDRDQPQVVEPPGD